MSRIYQSLDVTSVPRFPTQTRMHDTTDALAKRKMEVLAKQKRMIDRANLKLTKDLNEVSRMTCKSLQAAIAAAKRPGNFDYYKPPEDIAGEVSRGELQLTLHKALQVQGEIDEAHSELSEAESKKQAALFSTNAPEPKSLKEWFAHYGRPQVAEGRGPGWRTETRRNRKVYGGSGHHRAFKTQAVTMNTGRLTR